ncbi:MULTISPECIES: NfeD family protein [Cellvibrio]|jgi:membrane protein implicated in regulation of membrane protease activity|uniref:Membrane protein implicated in regulation of membrane protease activity n=1 Tax=Cellvibrio fibrivorans TaxID=126350 RepID=A0ABU1V0L8_9GAMM|nr:NfeD family protein [Cellvibrio fibrivorans]MDR7090993.1 membrane protein implicated in regulation of membrane protease activity [Cellvibrio fibrivorans]
MSGLFEYFAQHQDHLLYTIAGICLVLELSVLGMSGPLLFLALSCMLTGLMVTLGVISGWELEVLSVGVLAALSAALLWKPLRKFQNSGGGRDTSSDMIGKVLPVTQRITRDQGKVAYSGIDWQARLDAAYTEPVAVGSRAHVVAVEGALLLVKPE